MSISSARFRLCLVCSRAVPIESKELYCINDGSRLIEACPRCRTRITSPYAQFCPACGSEYRTSAPASGQTDAPDARGHERLRTDTEKDDP